MNSKTLKKLPIGIQTFSKIIEDDYFYIDKTKEALEVIEDYQYVFLSRPRRFGKSLFLDTLKNIYEGKKELFEGLYIYDKYEFEEYPVIKISWGGSSYVDLEEMREKANDILKDNQEDLQIECDEDSSPQLCFKELIKKSFQKYNKPVVILIDEYDKPILNNMHDLEVANQMRIFLRGMYEQLKENDKYIKFAFLTGITKFSKASIFSGLNNIEDISLNPDFGNICGYTQDNIENEFKEYFPTNDKNSNVDLERVKEWYNGYNFLKDPVYNPFDILQFIKNKFVYKNYWWKSGSAFAIIEILKKNQEKYFIPDLQNITISEEYIDSFDIEKLPLESLLFQAGYLTIDKMIQKRNKIEYKLKVPNREVEISLNELFMIFLTNSVKLDIQDKIYDTLDEVNFEEFENTLVSLFASIPYNNYVNNNISHFEGYYASVIYTYFASLGVKLIAEDVTNHGRIDLTLFIEDKIYVIEFKVMRENEKIRDCESERIKDYESENISTNTALEQIKTKNYHQKYLNQSQLFNHSITQSLYLIGIEFDEKAKNISSIEWEKI